MARPKLTDYIRPTTGNPAMLELVDPANGERLETRSLQPYSAMRDDERLRRGREFWRRCGRVVDLVVVCGRHAEASDHGVPGELEQLLEGAELFGFEGVGAPDNMHRAIARLPKHALRLVGGHKVREAQAVQKSGVRAFCYDVATPEKGAPGYDLDLQLHQVLKLGEMKRSIPTPSHMTVEQRAQWIVASGAMRDCFIFDYLGFRMDELTDGRGDARTVVTIGSGHRQFMERRLAAYNVDAPVLEHVPPPQLEAGIFDGAAQTGQVSVASIGQLAAQYH